MSGRHLEPANPVEFSSEWTRDPVARLRYTNASGRWEIYWRDRHLRFRSYDLAGPSPLVAELLAEIERDPTAIFWS